MLGLEPAFGVEAHKVMEHNLELMEVVHEAVGVGFTADCQVPTDFLTSLCIASQLFVPGCQQGVCYFVFVDFPGFCGLITPRCRCLVLVISVMVKVYIMHMVITIIISHGIPYLCWVIYVYLMYCTWDFYCI